MPPTILGSSSKSIIVLEGSLILTFLLPIHIGFNPNNLYSEIVLSLNFIPPRIGLRFLTFFVVKYVTDSMICSERSQCLTALNPAI